MTPEEDAIVAAVQRAVGPVPVLLAGSRALGTAEPASDWDVLAVLPARRVPFAVRRLAAVSRDLGAALGAAVTVNALPAFRLAHAGRNLFVWKVAREGRVLAAPPGFRLAAPEGFSLRPGHERSYLLSALVYLLESRDGRAVAKARRHLAQLDELRGHRVAGGGDSWDEVRDEVLRRLRALPPVRRSPVSDVQYAVLSALRGRARLVRRAEPRLAAAAVALAEGDAARAAALLPRSARPEGSSWESVRDAFLVEWPSAHPLLGL
jgi:hypothetical protein